MDRYIDIKEKIIEYASRGEDIKAIIAIGSSTLRGVLVVKIRINMRMG